MSKNLFDLTDRVAVITGGSGLLGIQHARAILSAGGRIAAVDVRALDANESGRSLQSEFGDRAAGFTADITNPAAVADLRDRVLQRFGRIDILINNAANNPKVEAGSSVEFSRLENFPLSQWHADIAVGLTGAFLCSQAIGPVMAKAGRGVILNIASDLAVIAPDQRLYRQEGLPDDRQPAKPVTYSIVKTALLGLTRYLATYWAEQGVRVNAISPGGVFNGQGDPFVVKLSELIPMKRMARVDEYQGAILFLCSDASSYMTGANLIVDGGRTCW